MGYVDKVYANIGEKLKVKMLNQLWPATIVEDSPTTKIIQKLEIDSNNLNLFIF